MTFKIFINKVHIQLSRYVFRNYGKFLGNIKDEGFFIMFDISSTNLQTSAHIGRRSTKLFLVCLSTVRQVY